MQMSTPAERPGSARSADVIHDIGYRHYSGPRLGRAAATRALYVQSLRAAYGFGRSTKSKILPILLFGLICVPALIVVAVALVTDDTELPVTYRNYLSATDSMLAIFVASQAPVALSRDLRFGTVPLYFSRPITRHDYVHAKLGAMVTAVFALAAAPVLVLFAGALLARMSFGTQAEQLVHGLVTALAYAFVFVAIAMVIAATTPRRGFGVAAIIVVMIISLTIAGIVFGVTEVESGTSAARWAGLLSPQTLVVSVTGWMFSLESQGGPDVPPSVGAGFVFLAELLVLVAGSYLLLRRRYRKI